MIESSISTFLLADAILSGLIASRLYPLKLPQKPTLPAVTYQRISGERVHDMSGASGLAEPRFQFDAWADKYLDAKSVADAIRKRLDGFKGLAETDTVQSALLESDRDFYEDDVKIWRVSMDYFIGFTEA